MLPHQMCQDRKLLPPLTSTRQLLLCTPNTGATLFPSCEKALPFSFRNLPSESCIPPSLLHTSNSFSYTEGARTKMSCWSLPPHSTLSSAPPTLELCPLLLKERHSESSGLAFPSVPLPSFAQPTTAFAFPTYLSFPFLAFHSPPLVCFALPSK